MSLFASVRCTCTFDLFPVFKRLISIVLCKIGIVGEVNERWLRGNGKIRSKGGSKPQASLNTIEIVPPPIPNSRL